MSTRTSFFRKEIIKYISDNFRTDIKILDVEPGLGIYNRLLKKNGFENIECVESSQDNIDKFRLDKKYKKIFHGDISTIDIDFKEYDLIILGGDLYNILKDKSVDVLKRLSTTNTIVSTFFSTDDSEINDEIFKKTNFKSFTEKNKDYHPLCLRYDYGVFINTKSDLVFIETNEKPLPSNMLMKLFIDYKNVTLQETPQTSESLDHIIEDQQIIENSINVENDYDIQNKIWKNTIVTALWDLGRSQISESFSRKYDDYLKKFEELLKTDIPMYIFADKSDEEFIWLHRKKHNTVVNLMSLDQLKDWFNFTEDTETIRKNPDWLSQAGWLPESPQAKLSGYNPLVMSKMFMLNNVTIWNPFKSDNFFWIDAGITNTVNAGYFTHDKVFNNLSNYLDENGEFIYISYPYIGGNEIHGFGRNEIAKLCNTDYVRYVCRGGFFGGTKDSINKINGIYYGYLNNTLKNGLMGTEESIFTIISHNHEDLIHRFEISDNGLIWPFFEKLKDYKEKKSNNAEIDLKKLIDKVTHPEKNIIVEITDKQKSDEEVAIYVIAFNSPNQFKTLIHSMMSYDSKFIDAPKKYLLNNSTDLSTTEQYEALCKAYGFEHIKKDNLGITGGRQWIAEHFNESEHKYYMFFEDDMFFKMPDSQYTYCRNGFNRFTPNLFDKVLKIMKKENFDFLKFNFSEFFGDNGTQWSWYNVPQAVREQHFPNYSKLPTQGLDPNAPRTEFKNIRSVDGLSYITGDVYYSNWPQIMSKEGNKKCFIDTKFQFPYEQTIMSFIFQETKKGVIKPGILLLTPTEHNRFDHYDASLRKEC